MRWSTSPRRKIIRPGLSSDLSVTNAMFASIVLMRSVQFPCRFSLQAIDSSWLCILCTYHYIKLCPLFLVIYDIVLILSESAAPDVSKDPRFGMPDPGNKRIRD